MRNCTNQLLWLSLVNIKGEKKVLFLYRILFLSTTNHYLMGDRIDGLCSSNIPNKT